MKRISILISLLIAFVSSYGQPVQTLGNPGNIVIVKGHLGVDTSLVLRKNYSDTGAANINAFTKNNPGSIIRVGDDLWIRNSTATAWVQLGADIITANSNTITLSGFGTTENPLTADVTVSGQPNNIVQALADGMYVPNYVQNGLISGGIITWVSGYTYDVTTATYAIGGVTYVAPETQITLANSDPTYDRFDAPITNTSSLIAVLTGTASDDPQNPSYDATTQMPLSFISVTAASTQPSSIAQDYIYLNNTEWTTSSSTARINPASTNNPYSPTLDVEATLAQNGDFISFTDPTQPTTMSSFSVLTMKLRSKTGWGSISRLVFRFYNDGLAVGNPVFISNGTFGFNTANTTTYQTITIPKQLFGALTDVDQLIATVSTTSILTIGFYLDDIQLQGGDGTIIPNSGGSFWSVGGNVSGATFVGGTLDNNAVQLIANNLNHTKLLTNGSTVMQGTNPGLAFRFGSFSGADHYLRSSGTSMSLNASGINSLLISGNTAYRIENNVSRGHEWYDMASNKIMQLLTSGELYLGTSFVDAGDYRFQLTGGARIDATSKTIALVGLSTDNTATQVAGKDASGNLIWRDVSTITGSATTADNGVTMSTATNVQLGSTSAPGSALLHNSFIDAATFYLQMTGTATQTLRVDNTGSGNAIAVNSTTGNGLNATASSSGVGVSGSSDSGAGVLGQSTSGNGVTGISSSAVGVQGTTSTGVSLRGYKFSAITSAVTTQLQLSHGSSGITTAGFGNAFDFQLQDASGIERTSARLISAWTDATAGTRTSQFTITGVSSSVAGNVLVIDGNGQITLPGSPYVGFGAGYLAVSNTGVLSWSAGAGGSGDVLKVGTPVNNQLGVWTGNGTIEGDANLTFASSTLSIGVAGAATGILTVSGVTSGTVTIQPASAAGTYTLTLPTDDGTSNQVLTTNGSGVLSWSSPAGVGTVTDVSVVSANGFAGSVATSTTTPAITISTSITGLLKGNGTAISAAVLGTDYVADNLYSANGTLSGDRTITLNGNFLRALQGATEFLLIEPTANNEAVTLQAYNTTGGGNQASYSGLTTATTATASLASSFNGGNNGLIELFSDNTGALATYTATTHEFNGTIDLNSLAGNGSGIVAVSNAGVLSWVAVGNGTVTNVSGTSNRITVATGTSTPVIDISASYVGQSSITTLGTIGTGVWQGTAVGVLYGGTGQTTYTNGQLLIGNTTGNTLTKATLTAGNGVSITNGSGSITIATVFNPTVQTLSDGATITWTVANGGNAKVTLAGTGRILAIPDPTAGYTYTIEITQGSGGSKTITTWPTGTTWATGTAPTLSTTAGDIDVVVLYYNGTNYRGTYQLDYN